jgi:Tfp pilus assembly protein PilO
MPKRIFLNLAAWKKDQRTLIRLGIGILLAANLVAAAFAFKPWQSSAEDLERQAAALRQQVRQRQVALEKLRATVTKVEHARVDQEKFIDKYLLGSRSMSSTLGQDLELAARKAGIRQKDTTFSYEPIEGSDTLTKTVITAIYEGTYSNLMHFLNLLDRSDRLLVVESLSAAPQQSGNTLGVTMKLSAYVREGGEPPPAMADTAPEPAAPVQQVVAPQPQVQRAAPPSPPRRGLGAPPPPARIMRSAPLPVRRMPREGER